MDKRSLRFRFEQRRGHYLVVEGSEDRPLTRRDCDEFQLRMLTSCEVPGLLKLEAEEIDGRLSLRYALTGTRMLSQAMRASKPTMAAYMGALCRLAEVMEDCRMYVLRPECLLLDDDRIFVGQAGDQDLRFVYLPIAAEQAGSVAGLETLIVRWMLQVADPDGKAIQQSIRIAASPDFKPAALSRFARAYLAGDPQSACDRPGGDPAVVPGAVSEAGRGNAERACREFVPASRQAAEGTNIPDAGAGGSRAIAGAAAAAASRSNGTEPTAASSGWRWFPPAAGEANGMSALLGDDADPYGEAPEAPDAPASPPDGGRKQVVVLCAAAGIIAVAWRWGYAASPGTAGLAISLGITVAVLAAAGWLSLSIRRKARLAGRDRDPDRPEHKHEPPGPGAAGPIGDQAAGLIAGRSPSRPEVLGAPIGNPREPAPLATVMGVDPMPWEEDRTQHLEAEPRSRESSIYYLECESETQAPPIPLTGGSLVIGRSREAAGHVDETPGVSRAHVELLRVGQGWTATDLGSRNGSKLNGAEMVAYEAYPLQPDDAIELAGAAVYRLKFGLMQRQAG